MAKKKSNLLATLIPVVSALLGVVALVLLCAPGMSPNSDLQSVGAKDSVSLASLAFGNEDSGLAFSFLIFLPFVLVLAGVVINVLSVLGKGGKILPIVAAACYLVAGILFFLVMQTYCVAIPEGTSDALKDAAIETAKKLIESTMTLGVGAILCGVFSLLSACLSVGGIFVKK